MNGLRQDLGHALRQVRRQPFFHLAVIVTLALGIGANAAVFSVVKATLLDALPYPDADRLVRIWNRNDARGWLRVDASLQELGDWRDRTTTFAAFAAFNAREGNLSGEGGAERIDYALVSADFLQALGIAPELGRDFRPEEDAPGAAQVAIVSHAFWRDRMGARADAIGSTVRLDDVPHTVIGVTPAGFAFPLDGTTLWKPFAMGREDGGPRDGRWIDVVARLRPEAGIARAGEELQKIAVANAEAFPAQSGGWTTWIEPLGQVASSGVRDTLLLVFATVGLVLLIACANVTNLLLSRTAARRRELAVRTALGAGRRRLIRQLLVESLTLAVLGGGLGILIARPLLVLVARLGETGFAAGPPPAIDGTVLAFTLLLATATGVLTGLLPALRSGGPPASVLRGGRAASGRRGGARAVLVAAEVALATTVLIGAGLLVRSLVAAAEVETGVEADALTLRLAPSWSSVEGREEAALLWRRIEERVAALPGVTATGAMNRLPLEGGWWTGALTARGATEQGPAVVNRVITPGVFDAAGIRLLRGRLPDATDIAAATRVMALSETAARLVFGDEDPIGAIVTNEDPGAPGTAWYTVVGVVSDVRYEGLEDDWTPATYTTFEQARWGHFGDWGMGLFVATTGPPAAAIPAVRAALAEVVPDLPIYEVRTMGGRIDAALAGRRATARLVGAFAGLALLLAAIGTYAVLATAVVRQIPEIGVRMALGASSGSILGLVLRRGMRPALAGVGIGLIGAAALGPAIRTMLYGVGAADPVTFGGIAIVLVAVSAAACLLPAWRASRLHPGRALAAD